MKLKQKIKRKLKQNFGKILIIGNIALVGAAADLNLMALETPIIDANSPIIANHQKTRESKQNEPNLTLVDVNKGTKEEIKEQIRLIAEKENFKWVDYILRLADCESKFNQYAENDNGEHGKDRGVFQINDKYHPEVSDEVAYDIEKATKWTMWRINNGYQHEWVCNNIILAQLF